MPLAPGRPPQLLRAPSGTTTPSPRSGNFGTRHNWDLIWCSTRRIRYPAMRRSALPKFTSENPIRTFLRHRKASRSLTREDPPRRQRSKIVPPALSRNWKLALSGEGANQQFASPGRQSRVDTSRNARIAAGNDRRILAVVLREILRDVNMIGFSGEALRCMFFEVLGARLGALFDQNFHRIQMPHLGRVH